jgi:hypothetical protein
MQGAFDPTNPRSSNTLGLFSFSIPTSGLATGTVVIFVAGRTFTGTISGIGDPNKSTLKGIVRSTTPSKVLVCDKLVDTTGTITILRSTDVTDRADGTLDASITKSSKAGASVTGTLLRGTGFVTAAQSVPDPGDCTQMLVNSSSLNLLVDGFKQAND